MWQIFCTQVLLAQALWVRMFQGPNIIRFTATYISCDSCANSCITFHQLKQPLAYPCQLEIQKLSKNQELPFDLHQPIYIVSLVKITFIYFNLVFYSFTEGAIFKCVHDKTISKREGEIVHELMRSINVLVFFTVSNINLSCFEKEWA